VDEDQAPEDIKPYLKHPVVQALAASREHRLLSLKRRVPPVRRSPNGHWESGCSGNPFGRPKGRTTVRKAFHQFGLEAVAKLAALADDPSLSPGERAVVLSQCVQLSCSVRSIRSDASMHKKLEQQRREAEMDAAFADFFRRVDISPQAAAALQAQARAALARSVAEPFAPEPEAASQSTTPASSQPPEGTLSSEPELEPTPAPAGEARVQPGQMPLHYSRSPRIMLSR